MKNRIHARGKEDNGSQKEYLARDEANKSQCQCKDKQKYSTTNINMDCPRTMAIWNYFPGDRGIQEYPHKINHMARDKI